jgi:hypothetical protein
VKDTDTALDDSENAADPGGAAPSAGAGAAARYKVWVILGEERLELPTTRRDREGRGKDGAKGSAPLARARNLSGGRGVGF